jgi:hypothetical protein
VGLVEAVLGHAHDRDLDHEADDVEQEEQRVLAPQCRLWTVAVGPVAVEEVGARGGHDRRHRLGLHLTAAQNRQPEQVEDREVHHEVDQTDGAELGQLIGDRMKTFRHPPQHE